MLLMTIVELTTPSVILQREKEALEASLRQEEEVEKELQRQAEDEAKVSSSVTAEVSCWSHLVLLKSILDIES